MIIVADSIPPDRILQKIGAYHMAFAESYKGDGRPGDGNFQDFNTSWRPESPIDVKEIWLEMFRRSVGMACQQGFNFCEFWGWPEVRCRDDGMNMVASRIRILRVTTIDQPRAN